MYKTLKKLSACILIVALTVMILPVYADVIAVPFDGDGTELNPYLITTSDDLVALGDLASTNDDAGDFYRSAHYRLTDDIDMSGVEFHAIACRAEKVIVDGETKYKYNGSGAFTGTIDGDCHIISNLNIDDVTNFYREDGKSFHTYDGFIGYGQDCDIKNLGLVNITLSGNATTTAAFVAGGGDGITIENCFVRGADFGNAAKAVAFVNGTGNNTTLTNCYCPDKNVYEFYNATAPTEGVKATNVYLKRALRTWSGYEKVNTLDTIQLATEEAISAFIAASNGAFSTDMFDVNGGYPVLSWENKFFSGGSGADVDPYLISTAEDLVLLGELSELEGAEGDKYRKAHYKLTEDIDMSDAEFHGICRRAKKVEENGTVKYIYNNKGQVFSGVIDGNGHIISNMFVDNYTDFFKSDGSKPSVYEALVVIGGDCTIKNLGLLNPKVNGGKATCAGLIAKANSAVNLENCFVKDIEYNDKPSTLAAFIALTADNSKIKNCYSTTNGIADHRGISGADPKGVEITNVYLRSATRKWSDIKATNYVTMQNLTGGDLTAAANSFVAEAGRAFVADTGNVNGGLPMLKWEGERVSENGTMIISDFIADGDANFEIIIKNCSTDYLTRAAAVAFYGLDNQMLAVRIYDDISLESGGAFEDISYLSDVSDVVRARLFLWDSLSNQQLLDCFECEIVNQ